MVEIKPHEGEAMMNLVLVTRALANQLIDSITSKAFDPTQYKDDVKERIEAQIQKKVEGEEITVPEGAAAPASAKVIDIMDALRSLDKQANGSRYRNPFGRRYRRSRSRDDDNDQGRPLQ